MNEFLNILAENSLEYVIAVVVALATCFFIPWCKNTLAPFLKSTVIPWLDERRLYGIVTHFVEAAEKYAENHEIDKKEYVLKLLAEKNIEVTPEIDAYIESAVKQLDFLAGEVIGIVGEALEKDNQQK